MYNSKYIDRNTGYLYVTRDEIKNELKPQLSDYKFNKIMTMIDDYVEGER